MCFSFMRIGNKKIKKAAEVSKTFDFFPKQYYFHCYKSNWLQKEIKKQVHLMVWRKTFRPEIIQNMSCIYKKNVKYDISN